MNRYVFNKSEPKSLEYIKYKWLIQLFSIDFGNTNSKHGDLFFVFGSFISTYIQFICVSILFILCD